MPRFGDYIPQGDDVADRWWLLIHAQGSLKQFKLHTQKEFYYGAVDLRGEHVT